MKFNVCHSSCCLELTQPVMQGAVLVSPSVGDVHILDQGR